MVSASRFWPSGANARQTSSLVARFGAGSDNRSHTLPAEAQSTADRRATPASLGRRESEVFEPAQMGFPLERECLDPRRRASDAPLDAAFPPAAAMRSDRRPVGRAARARNRGRGDGLPRTRAARYQAGPLRRARHARQSRRSANDHRGIRYDDATPECAHGHSDHCDVGREAAPAEFDIAKSDRRHVALWSIPSYVCSGDSGGGIFLNPTRTEADGDVTGRQRERWWT